jgi:hypothetical protein
MVCRVSVQSRLGPSRFSMRRLRPWEVRHLRPLQQAPQVGPCRCRCRRRRRRRFREYDRVQFVLMGEVSGFWVLKLACWWRSLCSVVGW